MVDDGSGGFDFGSVAESDESPDSDDEEPESAFDPARCFVTRDEEGRPNIITEDAGPYGLIRVRPMVYGEAERMFGDIGSAGDLTPDTVAELLRGHVVDPDLSAFAEEEYGRTLDGTVVREEMEPFAPAMLMQAVFRASGIDPDVEMGTDGSANVDFGSATDPEGN